MVHVGRIDHHELHCFTMAAPKVRHDLILISHECCNYVRYGIADNFDNALFQCLVGGSFRRRGERGGIIRINAIDSAVAAE